MAPVLTSCGPALSGDDIASVERELGAAFPDDYRAFLLRHNGGCPTPATFVSKWNPHSRVEEFFGLTPTGSSPSVVTSTRRFRTELELPEDFIAVGRYDDNGIVLLKLAGATAGRVFLWPGIDVGFDKAEIERPPIGFGEFLNRLGKEPDWVPKVETFREFAKLVEGPNVDELRKMIEGGYDVSYCPIQGLHPWFLAVSVPLPEVVELFLEHQIDPGLRNIKGETILEDLPHRKDFKPELAGYYDELTLRLTPK